MDAGKTKSVAVSSEEDFFEAYTGRAVQLHFRGLPAHQYAAVVLLGVNRYTLLVRDAVAAEDPPYLVYKQALAKICPVVK